MYKFPDKLFIGKEFLHFNKYPSTNTWLLDAIRCQPLPEGFLIITDHQTHGRGQRGKTWEVEAGKNFTFSFLLRPPLPVRGSFTLMQAISLGIKDYLNSQTPQPASIKWPNDIFYKNQKMGGVLIENVIRGTNWKGSVVGIGLNVNQKTFVLPSITSLALAAQRPFVLTEELPFLLACLEKRIANCYSGLSHAEEYVAALWQLGQNRVFIIKGKEMEATIVGIDDATGRIILDIQNERRLFLYQELTWVL